jgi:hypothetical protein
VRPRPLHVALFAGALLIAAFTMLRGIDPFDEGLTLQVARRVAEGQVPYQDFAWSYGPAQPYLLGGLFKAFGTSLLDWRIVRVLADAGVAMVVYAIVRREAGFKLALLAWFAAACFMAEPLSANPFPLALLAALGAIAVMGNAPLAGALTAVAAAFRPDFGAYAAVAVVAGLAIGRHWRRIGIYLGVAVGLALLVFLPFLIAVGPADLYDSLVGVSLRERDYWTLSFPLDYSGGVHGLRSLKDLLDFYVPLLLVLGLATAVAIGALRVVRERAIPATWVALGVFGVASLSYLLSRTDEFHATPLLVTLAALLPLVLTRAPRPLGIAAAALLALLTLHGAWNRASALVEPPDLVAVDLPVADGAKTDPAEAHAEEAMVAAVQRLTRPDDPIYVVTRRSDLVTSENPMVYVLADRDNPTRRDVGLRASAAAQASAVATLERVRPRVVVRWTSLFSAHPEPNLRGRSSGVHTLDDYLAGNYHLAERDGDYDILVPR